jgi:peptidoglycan/xylan/chitin deacetylase (PgdA/CDA1 family)
MSGKDKYIYFGSKKRGGRHLRKGIIFAVAVLGVAAMVAAAFAVKAGVSKEASQVSVSSAQIGAQSGKSKNSSSQQAAKTEKTTNRIPVLMYHSINYDPNDPTNVLRVPKAKFAAEMKWLYDNGYTTLSLDELYDAVSNNKPVYKKSVVLTFDDGYEDNFQSALPVIKQYHFKATVFMITSEIGDSKNGYLTAAELKEMDKSGMKIECHTVTHPDLDTLSYNKQYAELANSKAALETLLGRTINFIAYPSGRYNDNTIAAAKKTGYKMCFKMKGGIAALSDNRYEFPRAFVGENLADFISRVEGTAAYSK